MTWTGRVDLGEPLAFLIGIVALSLGRHIRRLAPVLKVRDFLSLIFSATIVTQSKPAIRR